MYHCRNLKNPETQKERKTTLIGAVDGGTGTIGSHVAKLILYTSLSLVCISNRNQRCLRKNFLHNGFSDYFLFCTKRGAFIHEQRSDRSRPTMRTFKKRKKECTLYQYLKKTNSAKWMQEICCPEVTLLNHTKIRYRMVFEVLSPQRTKSRDLG